MSYREPDLAGEVVTLTKQYKFYATPANPTPPAAVNAEITAVVAALGSDPTTHDCTIETPPAALKIGADKTRFTNDVLLLVNAAKGGNLSVNQIIAALDDAAGVAHAPAVVDTPYVSGAKPNGSVLTCTQGNWTGTPSSYAYAWKRNGTVAVGTSVNTYTTVVADVGAAIGCVVTATNVTGSTPAPLSNQIVVT